MRGDIGDTYYDMGEHEKAVPYFQKAIQINPNHANAHLLLGLSYRALNRGEEARVTIQKNIGTRARSSTGEPDQTVAGGIPLIVSRPTSFTEKYVRAKSRKPIVRFQVISNKPDALQVWCNPVFRGSYWVRGSGTAHKKCKNVT